MWMTPAVSAAHRTLFSCSLASDSREQGMTSKAFQRLIVETSVECAIVVLLAVSACSTSNQDQIDDQALERTSDEAFAPEPDRTNDIAQMSGSQLWEAYCARCHYMRPPRWYSDTEWDVAMLHMRIQLNLTGDEQRKIRDYLQAAN